MAITAATTQPRSAPGTGLDLRPRSANAATHGLTARKHLPEILGPELLNQHRERFFREWNPRSATECQLVEEMARHAAALERATLIEEAVLRTAASGLGMLSVGCDGQGADLDRILAATCGTEAIDRLTRYRRAHEKGFHTALGRLRELRAASTVDALIVAGETPPLRFTEEACSQYLRARFARSSFRCTTCGGAGKFIAGRDVWQCDECRRQFGLRCDTVMQRSAVPLHSWFAAIAVILRDPNASTAALCEATGIRREKTVRLLAARIRAALESPDAKTLLAGLDRSILEELGRTGC